MNCNTCVHFGLYQMITSHQPYGYGGDIPCHRCVHYCTNDEYVQAKDAWGKNQDDIAKKARGVKG